MQFHIILLLLLANQLANAYVNIELEQANPLIEKAGEILCSFRIKTTYVFFENSTSLGYSSHLLKVLNSCSITYMNIRNKFLTERLEIINDDYILMHLVMIQRNTSQPMEMSIIRKKSAAKHVSYTLVLIEDSAGITLDWLHDTFQKFWKLWVLNVVILFWRDGQLHVYRYNPFAVNDYLLKVTYSGRLPLHADLYPSRLPDMKGRPLRMCMYEDDIRAVFHKDGRLSGADGLMANYIANRLNATAVVHSVSFAGAYNRSEDVCFYEVHKGIDDIAMNIRFLTGNVRTTYKLVESSVVHVRDDLCVLVPKAEIATTFWNLFRPFNPFVWLSIALSLPLVLLTCAILYGRSFIRSHFILQLYSTLLLLPFTHVSPRFSVRVLLCFWMFYVVLIGNAFKGNLTSNLVLRKYLPDINTIEDLALSPYNLLLFPRHQKHLDNFLDPSNPVEAIIIQKMRRVPVFRLLQLIKQNNVSYAYLEKYHVARHQSANRINFRNGRPLYHMMSTCLVPFHAVFIMPYGSPIVGFVNYLIRCSHEFGFYIYWNSLTSHATYIKSASRARRFNYYNDDLVVLRIDHFIAAFCILAVGLAAAMLVFFWEMKG